MSKIELTIDGIDVTAEEGERLLWVALDAGIYIPNLCAGREIDHHPAACRLCFVEIEGYPEPVTSCTVKAAAGMTVRTRSERVDRLVRSGFELLMSTHRLECKVCPAKKTCGLLEISRKRRLPLRPRRVAKLEPDWPVDDTHPLFGINPNRCVLCGKCVRVANEIVKCREIDFQKRGLLTFVGAFEGMDPTARARCAECMKCVEVCPVGALYRKV